MATNAFDKRLIKLYGKKTPTEIAEILGLEDAAEVAQRTEALINSRNYLSEDAQINLLLFQLQEMVTEASSRLADASDSHVSQIINAGSGAIGRMLGTLHKLRESSKLDATAIGEHMGNNLAEIMNIALYHLRDELKERYPTDDEEIDELVIEGIRIGTAQLDAKIAAQIES